MQPLRCLLQEDSEAYLSDVTRPVKQELPRYLEIEKPLQEAIWNKYLREPLTAEESAQVFAIDDALLFHEFAALMDTRFSENEPELQSKPDFGFSGFEETKQEFLRCFHTLI